LPQGEVRSRGEAGRSFKWAGWPKGAERRAPTVRALSRVIHIFAGIEGYLLGYDVRTRK